MFSFIWIGVALGAVFGIWYVLALNRIENRIKSESDPLLQQQLWQHYATWQNSNLPLAARNTGLQAINSHFELKALKEQQNEQQNEQQK